MKTYLTYGFYMALGGGLLNLALYFLGFHSDAEKLRSAQLIGTVVGIAIGVVCILLAMRERRAARPPAEAWGYGSALGAGVWTGFFGSLFSMVTNYAYFAIINPNMSEIIFQAQTAKMEAKGMSPEQIEKIEPMMRKFMTPLWTTAWGFIGGLVFCVIIALITAAFVISRPSGNAEPAPTA